MKNTGGSAATLPRRVLIIGLDAATLNLVQPWVEQGLLPNIESFFSHGAVGPMRSVATQCSAAAWSSMVTGVNPGKHGLYWFTLDKPGTYEQSYVNASYQHGETLWRRLSDAGMCVGAINVPISYPAEEVNGFVIAGIDTPGVHATGFTYPQDLAAALRAEVGEYTIEPGIPSWFKVGKVDAAVETLHTTIAQRAAYTRHLMETTPWDFLMVVFRSTDPAQHFFWKYMSPQGFQVDAEDVRRYSSVILDVYRQIDTIIDELVELAGGETAVLLVSDHGGIASDRRNGVLPYWLEHLGFMRRSSQKAGLGQRIRGAASHALRSLYKQLDRRATRPLKLLLATRFCGLRRRVEATLWYRGVDWSQTVAYCDGKRSDIWVNLSGRQPQGVVEPGAEYEQVRDKVIRALTTPRDPETGEPFAWAVHRREEIYHGPFVERSPDLIVAWNRDADIGRLELGDLTGADVRSRMESENLMKSLISGAHDRDGLVAIKGPGILPGAHIHEAHLLDVAPTVLYLLGQPIPAEMDGRVLCDAIAPQTLAKHPMDVQSEGKDLPATGVGYSEEEARIIGERLRGLGYVD